MSDTIALASRTLDRAEPALSHAASALAEVVRNHVAGVPAMAAGATND